MTVPAGTQTGQTLRIRGKGCPRLDREGRGDLLVQTRVVIPRNPDSALQEVLQALRRLLPDDPRASSGERRTARRPRRRPRVSDRGRPLYRISVVAEMLALHPQTLRLYERKGLIRPSRTTGRTRLYSRTT